MTRRAQKKRGLWGILLFLFSGPADAQQLMWDIDRGGGQWAFTTAWKDAEGQRQSARFTLPAAPIKEDLKEPLYVGLNKIYKVAAHDINTHNFGKGVSCEATVTNKGMRYGCTSKKPDKQGKAIAVCEKLIDDRKVKWLGRHGFIETEDGEIVLNWAQHVLDYAPALAPVVAGLGGPTQDPRKFAERALGFVQTIPYEARGSKPDKYRRPLSILGRNRGDCDSKTVLYLALLHQAYPELGLGVVVIRKHAFGAVALAFEAGDASVKVDGERWVAVEPVGPALNPVGQLGGHSRRAVRRRRYHTQRAT